VLIDGRVAWEEAIHPDHLPAAPDPERDAEAADGIEHVIDQPIRAASVGRHQRQGREEVAIAQRPLLDVVCVHPAILAVEAVEEPRLLAA
jgi:hypothetical protein